MLEPPPLTCPVNLNGMVPTYRFQQSIVLIDVRGLTSSLEREYNGVGFLAVLQPPPAQRALKLERCANVSFPLGVATPARSEGIETS